MVQAVGAGVDVATGIRIAGMTNLKHGGYGEEALLKADSAGEAAADALYSTAIGASDGRATGTIRRR